jgi:hypothetical protein
VTGLTGPDGAAAAATDGAPTVTGVSGPTGPGAASGSLLCSAQRGPMGIRRSAWFAASDGASGPAGTTEPTG